MYINTLAALTHEAFENMDSLTMKRIAKSDHLTLRSFTLPVRFKFESRWNRTFKLINVMFKRVKKNR
jgi:hypothetical protein